jgi:hypothetical protein
MKSYTERSPAPLFTWRQYLTQPFCTTYEAYPVKFFSKEPLMNCNATKRFLFGANEMEPVAEVD